MSAEIRPVLRPQPESRVWVVHWNKAASAVCVCDAYDTVCGVSCFMLDRWVTSNWRLVTCQRCLRHQRRLNRFKSKVKK